MGMVRFVPLCPSQAVSLRWTLFADGVLASFEPIPPTTTIYILLHSFYDDDDVDTFLFSYYRHYPKENNSQQEGSLHYMYFSKCKNEIPAGILISY